MRFGACELETLSLRDKPDADIVERRRPQRPSNIAACMWIFILLENRDAVTREREQLSLKAKSYTILCFYYSMLTVACYADIVTL